MRGPKCVLVVDDDPAIRKVVGQMLLDEGYRVFVAPNGRTALTIIEGSGSHPFALILLDMKMPGIDGWTFADVYHRLPGPHAPLIVFTARCGNDAAMDAEQIGAMGFLTKPFDLDALVALVARFTLPSEPCPTALAPSLGSWASGGEAGAA